MHTHHMASKGVPLGMPKQEREAIISELEELLSVAEMKNASFAFGKSIEPIGDVTEFIKEETRLYRESWLINPLRQMIERYKSGESGNDARWKRLYGPQQPPAAGGE